jgi:F420-dependent oxidoreductase-like protein
LSAHVIGNFVEVNMQDIAVMIEGQNGLNWHRWQKIAHTVESLGFAGLFRSDHFTNSNPPDRDSLGLWTSLTWLASHTERIEFGPLVTPMSFRHPVFTARMARDVDDLSGGRLTLGVGAGWQEREHDLFGFDLLDLGPRFDRFEEGLQVIVRLLRSGEAATFKDDFYELEGAALLPRPVRKDGPPLLIGGNGPKRTLPLAASFADEWNGVFIGPDRYRELNQRLTDLLQHNGRDPGEVRRSVMTGLVFGRDQRELDSYLETYEKPAEALKSDGVIVGMDADVKDQIEAYAQAGAQRIMLQWLDLDNLDGLEALAQALL